MPTTLEPTARTVPPGLQSEALNQVATLTGLRDRDKLDEALAIALDALIRPTAIAVYRTVGDAGERRWVPRAQVRRGRPDPTLSDAWADLNALPLLSDHPLRLAALAGRIVTSDGQGHHATVFPLTPDAATVGVVEVFSDSRLDAAARKLVSAILRINGNVQSLLDYCERDTLTGLLNRKTFDASFFKALPPGPGVVERRWPDGAARASWLAMIDIDFFKSVNDNHGHLIGDEVLLLLAQLMRSTLRVDDRVYRFGGEEFVAVLQCERETDVAGVLERLRRDTEAFAFPQVGRLTISIGFTPVLPSDSPSSALERADRAVYYAKTHGRNRVCSHSQLVASGRLEAADKVGGIELF
jgi:diguanylate cyclase (GGDEF)-like protein